MIPDTAAAKVIAFFLLSSLLTGGEGVGASVIGLKIREGSIFLLGGGGD
jgi:hypothetical protein